MEECRCRGRGKGSGHVPSITETACSTGSVVIAVQSVARTVELRSVLCGASVGDMRHLLHQRKWTWHEFLLVVPSQAV